MDLESVNLNKNTLWFDPAFRANMTPFKFGLTTFITALAFTLVSFITDNYNDDIYPFYLWYYENISWSISLLLIFPTVLGLSLNYYQKAPMVLQHLYTTLVKPANPDAYNKLCQRITRTANFRLLPSLLIICAVAVNILYFRSLILNPDEPNSWMLINEPLTILDHFHFKHRFTAMGLVGALIQIYLTYWVLMLLVKNLIFIRGLYRFFQDDNFTIKLDPIHPDGVSGLGQLKDLATLQASILLLFGLYASLKVIDKIYVQSQSLPSDIGNPLVLLVYAIAAPLLFFLILGSAHQKMRETKEHFLRPICKRISILIDRINHTEFSSVESSKESIEQLKFLQEQNAYYSQKISLWPFNWRSMQGFFGAILGFIGAVITPMIPPIAAGISYIAKVL